MAFYKGAAAESQRAQHLMKKRQQQHDEMEKRKKKLEEDTEMKGMKYDRCRTAITSRPRGQEYM